MEIDCPFCGAALKASEELAGKFIRCPNCKKIFNSDQAPKVARVANDVDNALGGSDKPAFGDGGAATGAAGSGGDGGADGGAIVALLEQIAASLKEQNEILKERGKSPKEEEDEKEKQSIAKMLADLALANPTTGMGKLTNRARNMASSFYTRGKKLKERVFGTGKPKVFKYKKGMEPPEAAPARAPMSAMMKGGIAAGAAAIFAIAVTEFGKAAYAFARGQEAEARRLAQFGPSQAAAMAKLDAERIGRDVKTAAETGGSSESLAESISSFEDKLRPWESLLTNIANSVGGTLLDVMGGILDAVKPLVDLGTKIYNALPWTKNIEPPIPMWDVMKDIAEKQEAQAQPKWPQVGPNGGPRGGR